MVAISHAHCRALLMRGGRAPRWWRDWRSRTQCGSPGSARLEARQLQGGSGVTGNAPTRTADFVILGAGVMGTSIAFHLARRKAGSVAVLDKDHVGSGGSSRSSALVRMHYS